MRIYHLFSFGIILVCFAHFAHAQTELTAEEKKQLREEVQYLGRNLPEFKAFFDSLNVMQPKIDSVSRVIKVQEKEILEREQELSNVRVKVNELEAELERLRNIKPNRARNIYFKLQIAAFEKQTPLATYFERYPKFVRFETHQNARKYTIGHFTHYWEVKQIEKLLLDMGAQVFVVPYEDGKRIDIKSVPEEYL